jgi:hypothetical protein
MVDVLDSHYLMFFQAVFILNLFMIFFVRNGSNSRYSNELFPGNTIDIDTMYDDNDNVLLTYNISGSYNNVLFSYNVKSYIETTINVYQPPIVPGEVYMRMRYLKTISVADHVVTFTPDGFDMFTTPWFSWFDYAIFHVLFSRGS